MMTTDEHPDALAEIFQLVFERVTTLSVQVETLRGLLEAHGVFTPAAFDQQAADLRTRWGFPQHPHASLSDPRTAADFAARLTRLLTPDSAGGPTPVAGA